MIAGKGKAAGALLHPYFAGSAVGVAHDVHAALLIGEAAAAKVVVTTEDRSRSLNLHMTDAFGNKGTISLNHVRFIAIGISYCNLQMMLCINFQSRGFIFVVSDTWDFSIIHVYLH